MERHRSIDEDWNVGIICRMWISMMSPSSTVIFEDEKPSKQLIAASQCWKQMWCTHAQAGGVVMPVQVNRGCYCRCHHSWSLSVVEQNCIS